MKTKIILGVVSVLVVGAGAIGYMVHTGGIPGVIGSDGFTVCGHRMGESTAEFARIEAKRYQMNLDDCDAIGPEAKRYVCYSLVKYPDAKPVEVKNTRVTYNQGGWAGPGVPEGLSKPWEDIFIDGKQSEIHFWPPYDQYVTSLLKNYGKPDQLERPPSQQEATQGF